MGLLDSVIGGVLGQVLGGRGHGSTGAMSPVVKALLMLLLSKGAGGAFGDVFGRGGPADERTGSGAPQGRRPGGNDPGGYDQHGGRRDGPSLPPGDFSDLSGMLDGPDARGSGAPSPRPPSGGADDGPDLGGLDGLIDRFRRGGLGDEIESWIGGGDNRSVSAERLGSALGPEAVGALEQHTGLDRSALLGELAKVLPEVVSRLTPDGRVPEPSERHDW